jgi:hypothetical protein
MSATISYSPVNDGDHYTIAQLNALFATLASIINNKIDRDDQEPDQVVVGPDNLVYITSNAQDPIEYVVVTKQMILPTDLTVNGQELVNAGVGVNPGDSVQVIQALAILGIQ